MMQAYSEIPVITELGANRYPHQAGNSLPIEVPTTEWVSICKSARH
jgi:hypothetical protein